MKLAERMTTELDCDDEPVVIKSLRPVFTFLECRLLPCIERPPEVEKRQVVLLAIRLNCHWPLSVRLKLVGRSPVSLDWTLDGHLVHKKPKPKTVQEPELQEIKLVEDREQSVSFINRGKKLFFPNRKPTEVKLPEASKSAGPMKSVSFDFELADVMQRTVTFLDIKQESSGRRCSTNALLSQFLSNLPEQSSLADSRYLASFTNDLVMLKPGLNLVALEAEIDGFYLPESLQILVLNAASKPILNLTRQFKLERDLDDQWGNLNLLDRLLPTTHFHSSMNVEHVDGPVPFKSKCRDGLLWMSKPFVVTMRHQNEQFVAKGPYGRPYTVPFQVILPLEFNFDIQEYSDIIVFKLTAIVSRHAEASMFTSLEEEMNNDKRGSGSLQVRLEVNTLLLGSEPKCRENTSDSNSLVSDDKWIECEPLDKKFTKGVLSTCRPFVYIWKVDMEKFSNLAKTISKSSEDNVIRFLAEYKMRYFIEMHYVNPKLISLNSVELPDSGTDDENVQVEPNGFVICVHKYFRQIRAA
ncbi:hypothetical protein Ciccas_003645 [Cichlidogyrus casuarinus]|uniref:Uncharacterized protein n=1 Tax=Cichlidogyrus casuarinus TaxID=1844966 RepID=A0ABD2QE79_9PLAT